MNKLFELIIEASIYGSITGISILIVKGLLRKNLLPKWTCILWLLLVIKLIIPFGPESEISIFNKFNNANPYKEDIFSSKADSITITDLDLSSKDIYSYNDIPSFNNTISDTNHNSFDIKIYLPTLWLIIAVSVFICMTTSYMLFSIKLRNYTNINNINLQQILQYSKSKFNIDNNIDLIVTEYISTPSLIGIFKPIILLPVNMVDLNAKQIEYIFLHELSHYKRKDNLLNLILILIQSLHWFNPFIWYLFKKLREDIELATDEKVLNILNCNEFDDYGLTLISVLSRIKNKKRQPSLVYMAKNKKNVENRIMNIKFMKNSKNKNIAFTLVGILAIGVAAPAILTNAKIDNDIVYANNEDTNISKNNLSEMQNTYFNLIELKESNAELDRNEVHKITKNLTMKTDNLGDDEGFIVDTYSIGNELLTVSYDKRDGQYVIRNMWYSINDNTKDVYCIRLHYADLKESTNKLGIEVVTKDINIVDDISTLLDMDTNNNELYKIYLDILKDLNLNKELTEDDITKLSSNLTKRKNGSTVVLSNNTSGEELMIKFDDSSEKVISVGLGDVVSLRNQKETIWTKTKNYPTNDFFSNDYNFPKDDSASVINKFENDIEKIKEYFIMINNTY